MLGAMADLVRGGRAESHARQARGMRMRFAERVIKSVRNRARVGTMRLRGAFTRALMPLVLTGGRRLIVGRNVDIVLYGELCIGVGVVLADGCALEVAPGGRLVIGDHVVIGRHTDNVAHEP